MICRAFPGSEDEEKHIESLPTEDSDSCADDMNTYYEGDEETTPGN